MMRSRPLWLRRTVAIGLLALTLGVLWIMAVAPLVEQRAALETGNARLIDEIARFEAIAALEEPLEERLRDLEDEPANLDLYLEGNTETVAAAMLQERLKAVIEDYDGQIRSVGVIERGGDEEGEARRVAVRVQARLSQEALAETLYDIETGRPMLYVESVALDLDRRSERRRRRNDGGAGAGEPMIVVDMVVSGFLQTALFGSEP